MTLSPRSMPRSQAHGAGRGDRGEPSRKPGARRSWIGASSRTSSTHRGGSAGGAARGAGAARILTRFGSMPAPLADRVAAADRETLDRLLGRVVLASSIDEIDEAPA